MTERVYRRRLQTIACTGFGAGALLAGVPVPAVACASGAWGAVLLPVVTLAALVVLAGAVLAGVILAAATGFARTRDASNANLRALREAERRARLLDEDG